MEYDYMKSIIIGNVREEFYDSPIRMFEMAVRLSKQNDFTVRSNNAQFIEALEVLNGEENVIVCVQTYHNPSKLVEISFQEAYNYLGDVYDIINTIRFTKEICDDKLSDDDLINEIKEYREKWKGFE